jgi:hypothetical protein
MRRAAREKFVLALRARWTAAVLETSRRRAAMAAARKLHVQELLDKVPYTRSWQVTARGVRPTVLPWLWSLPPESTANDARQMCACVSVRPE